MPLPYREFATWTLRDLAIRKREGDWIIFEGNHVTARHSVPVRHADETPEQFAARIGRLYAPLAN